MKRGWPLFFVGFGCLAAGSWWLLRPVGPRLPAAVASALTTDKRMPHPFLVGSAPPGTAWEMYVVPIPYSRVVEAMKTEPGWQVSMGHFMGADTRAMYRSTDPDHPGAIDVLPGRFMILDTKTAVSTPNSESGEDYSIVAVASPAQASVRKTALAWIDRLLGRKALTFPKGTVLAYVPPSKAAPPTANGSKPLKLIANNP